MYRVRINPHWEISAGDQPSLDTATLLQLLLSIQKTGSISQAAREVHLSYRYAWGLLREGEKLFGDALMQTGRGRGTVLTPLAEKLVWADRRIGARLSPILESLASELEGELNKMFADKLSMIRMSASHGFAVAALLAQMIEAHLPIELNYRNSTDAVIALARRECDLAGFHVPLGKFEAPAYALYAPWLDTEAHCLLHLSYRAQGLFVAPGNPKGIHTLQDLTRSGVRFVNRQAGSGTRRLLELMLADAAIPTRDISGFASAEFTHSAVAAYIASGMADVGFGVQTAAARFGLEFIPMMRERYFFALPASAINEPLMQSVLALIRTPGYHATLDALPGYDSSDTGGILTISEAFGTAAVQRHKVAPTV
jgi:molybdate transport repressor ModE-like protein